MKQADSHVDIPADPACATTPMMAAARYSPPSGTGCRRLTAAGPGERFHKPTQRPWRPRCPAMPRSAVDQRPHHSEKAEHAR